MCGRFVMLTREEIESVVAAVQGRDADALPRIEADSQGRGRVQARPGSEVALFCPDGHGKLEIADAQWGFEVEWSKRPVFNTRIESAMAGAAMWRNAVQDGRCVIPAAAFFEPHESETIPNPKTGRVMKRPYQFCDPDGVPLLLAGVQEGGRCSIVTCEPNRWVAPVHPRMPLALRFHEVVDWFGPNWASLANRNMFELEVEPERLMQPGKANDVDDSAQMSLFSLL